MQSLKFHVISTNPSIKSVSTLTPSLSIDFSKPLAASGLRVTMSPSGLRSYSVAGKKIIILFDSPLLAGQTYLLRVSAISNTSGGHIEPLTYHITPLNLNFNQLSKSQQAAILKQQVPVQYSQNTITFSGDDLLQSAGLSANQLNELKRAVFDYSGVIHKQFKAAIISQVALSPHDPESASTSDSGTFNIALDGTTYTARINYWDVSTLQLQLHNNRGDLVYDSGRLSLE